MGEHTREEVIAWLKSLIIDATNLVETPCKICGDYIAWPKDDPENALCVGCGYVDPDHSPYAEACLALLEKEAPDGR